MELQEAIALGLKRYSTGRPCRNGHVAERRVADRNCISCQSAMRHRWREQNRERELKMSRARRKLQGHGYNEAAKVRMRAYYRKKLGIPEATHPCPVHCECCGKVLEPGKKTHLDHDHVTGKFRGWLCNSCNLGIGALGDSIEGVKKALTYLRRA